MPDRLRRELLETLAQSRSLLEDLRLIGEKELHCPQIPTNLPVCPIGVRGVGEGGDAACRSETLEEIRAELSECRRCALCSGRKTMVFGEGNPEARLVLVGEAPGREEDLQGRPFVGEAGRLLERILFAMGLQREQVYICNVIKCRPPQNRDPSPEEIAACEPYLQRQLAAIRPRVIVTLGRFAAQTLLRNQTPISQLRGQWQTYQGVALMPTYHPAYLLRNPAEKRDVWEDMKQVMQRLKVEAKP